MLRVTSPGGLVLAAEPNNRASLLLDTSVSAGASVEELVDLMRFALTCERGKEALGEGNNSIGDLLPGYLAAQDKGDAATHVGLGARGRPPLLPRRRWRR